MLNSYNDLILLNRCFSVHMLRSNYDLSNVLKGFHERKELKVKQLRRTGNPAYDPINLVTHEKLQETYM